MDFFCISLSLLHVFAVQSAVEEILRKQSHIFLKIIWRGFHFSKINMPVNGTLPELGEKFLLSNLPRQLLQLIFSFATSRFHQQYLPIHLSFLSERPRSDRNENIMFGNTVKTSKIYKYASKIYLPIFFSFLLFLKLTFSLRVYIFT